MKLLTIFFCLLLLSLVYAVPQQPKGDGDVGEGDRGRGGKGNAGGGKQRGGGKGQDEQASKPDEGSD